MTHASTFRTRAQGRRASLSALLVAASMTLAATSVYSTVVCLAPNIAVPPVSAGLYLNLFTGVAGPSASGRPGWDFNPWGDTNLGLYSNNPAGAARFVIGPGTAVSTLAAGTPIGAAATFATTGTPGPVAVAAYRAGVTPATYLGIRFVEGGLTYFGGLTLTTTAPGGVPATVNQFCYDNTPDATIIAGSLPVSLQAFSIE